MTRRELLRLGLGGAPFLLGVRSTAALAAGAEPLALATADTEAHVVAVSLATGRIRRRLATRPDPRSIEGYKGLAVVAHTAGGAVSILENRPLHVRRVLRGFVQPRYTAIAPGGRHAFTSDSGTGELAVIDLRAAKVINRVAVGDLARHLTLSPDGRTVWVSLGSSAAHIVVVDVSDPAHPRPRRRIAPPFLAHDVGFSPTGRRVWVTAGRERRLAIYDAAARRAPVLLGGDEAPQHVAFGPGAAYVASGDGASVRVHSLSDGRRLRTTKVPYGSYNVQRSHGRVLTPSLSRGTLTILDPHGRVLHETRVAPAAHDACVIA